jgi:hypothetical protein
VTQALRTRLVRRLRIFALGVTASIALTAAFFTLAWLVNDSPSYAWVGRLLIGLIEALNPLLPVFQRAILRTFPAPSPEGLVVIQVVFVALFLSWWWLVAVVVDRVLTRRQPDPGAA